MQARDLLQRQPAFVDRAAGELVALPRRMQVFHQQDVVVAVRVDVGDMHARRARADRRRDLLVEAHLAQIQLAGHAQRARRGFGGGELRHHRARPGRVVRLQLEREAHALAEQAVADRAGLQRRHLRALQCTTALQHLGQPCGGHLLGLTGKRAIGVMCVHFSLHTGCVEREPQTKRSPRSAICNNSGGGAKRSP